jgi:hypothetical protein
MSNARSVATDALATLGTIIDDTQKRDAIHIAVEPVIAGERLRPGDHTPPRRRPSTGPFLGKYQLNTRRRQER